MYLKRKSTYLYDSDDEEEDEWEREASFSSTTSSKKQPKPNPFAIKTDMLNDQYKALSDTRQDMEEELQRLSITLEELEHEDNSLSSQLDESKQEYIDSVSRTISIIQSQAENKSNTSENDYSISIQYDESITKQLGSYLQDWNKVLETGQNNELTKKQIDALTLKYKRTEFEIIDLIAQINGYQSRIQSLQHDMSKLNSLPQYIPVIQSDTEKHKLEIEQMSRQLEQLEKGTIKPYLTKLAELKILIPLCGDQYERDMQLLNDILDDIEEIYKMALKQRAFQYLVTYLSEETTIVDTTVEALTAYASLLDIQPKQEEQQPTKADQKEVNVELLEKLLDQYLKSKEVVSREDLTTLGNRVFALKEYAAMLKQKWGDDFNACLDAARELDGLQSRLSDSLFTHSKSSDKLLLTPKPYTNLQGSLESRILALKKSINDLEKNMKDPGDKARFELQKKLFSAFFTDSDEFLIRYHQAKKSN